MSASLRSRALAEMGFAPLWRTRKAGGTDADLGGTADLINSAAGQLAQDSETLGLAIEGLGLEELGRAIKSCLACDRFEFRQQATSGTGPSNAVLMVIDDVPSQDASSLGEFLDATPARLLDQMLFTLGLKRQQVYLTHAVRCDGAPVTSAQSATCSAYLLREIEMIQPHALLVLSSAARATLERLGKWSDKDCFEVEHPQRMLGNASAKRQAWKTLSALKRHLHQSALLTP